MTKRERYTRERVEDLTHGVPRKYAVVAGTTRIDLATQLLSGMDTIAALKAVALAAQGHRCNDPGRWPTGCSDYCGARGICAALEAKPATEHRHACSNCAKYHGRGVCQECSPPCPTPEDEVDAWELLTCEQRDIELAKSTPTDETSDADLGYNCPYCDSWNYLHPKELSDADSIVECGNEDCAASVRILVNLRAAMSPDPKEER